MGPLRLYFRYVGVSVKAQLEYRASTILLTVGSLSMAAIEFLALWALFDRFGQVRGYTLAEVSLLYGMANLSFALAEGGARGFDLFANLVKSGDFDRLLLRPRATAFQVAASEVQLARAGRGVQGLVVLLVAAASLGVSWTVPKAILLAGAVAGGACVFAGLFVLQAALSFFTIESLEVMNIATYGGVETAQYPMSIYTTWFRRFFTFVVPLACVNFYPVLAILGRGGPSFLGWISPPVGLIFLLVCLKIFSVAERHYRSTGS